jgi:hypothetical protein
MATNKDKNILAVGDMISYKNNFDDAYGIITEIIIIKGLFQTTYKLKFKSINIYNFDRILSIPPNECTKELDKMSIYNYLIENCEYKIQIAEKQVQTHIISKNNLDKLVVTREKLLAERNSLSGGNKKPTTKPKKPKTKTKKSVSKK